MAKIKVRVFINNREVKAEELKIRNSTVNKIVNEIANLNENEKLGVA